VGDARGHVRLACDASIHSGRTTLLFGFSHRDRLDVAFGISPSATPDRRTDGLGFRPDGRFSLFSRSQHFEPPGDDDASIWRGCRLPEGPVHLLIDTTGLKVYAAGEWLQEKNGAKARRTWRKLDLAVDADAGMIMSSTLTENDAGDPSQVTPLLERVDAEIGSATADGAYDGTPTYEAIAARTGDIQLIIPPHITLIAERGRLGWQKETGYGRSTLVETTMGRYMAIIGPGLRARSLSGQRTETAVGVAVLNRMLHTGRPNSVRRSQIPS
jgi:hypothetical protein